MDAGFVIMFVITIVTGVYSVISSLGLLVSSSALINNVIGTGVFLLAPLAIPAAEKIRGVMSEKWNLNRERKVYDFTIEELGGIRVGDRDLGVKDEEGDDHDVDIVGVREEIGVKKMLIRLDFWLYFFVYFSSATLGLVFLNNLGQIAESRGSSRTSSLVSLSSSFGFFGRLVPSLLDYHFSR